jgi:cell wall assembly regulator SMI1
MSLCNTIRFRTTKDVRALVESGADVNALDTGWLPLVVAAEGGKTDVARLLLKHGAAPNGVDGNGDTPLIAAARRGKAPVVRLLLKHGADVNHATPMSKTPLTEAIQGATKGHTTAAQLLIDAGAEVNGDYRDTGQTLLMLASKLSSPEMIEILLRAGADIDAVRPVGTALTCAVWADRPRNVEMLVHQGADQTLRIPDGWDPEWDGKTALELAQASKAKKMIQILTGETSTPEVLPEVSELWQRVEELLNQREADERAELRPGASDKDFKQLEDNLGKKLPKEFRASYRIHNGQVPGVDLVPAVSPDDEQYELMTLEGILGEWHSLKELLDGGDFADLAAAPAPEVKDAWWSPAWVPFATNGAGDHLCLDLEPTRNGSRGQVISVSHESAAREVVAGSFNAWLFTLLEQLREDFEEIAARNGKARERRIERYRGATVEADDAFRKADYASYVSILEPFDDLLTPTQQKKLSLAKRKAGRG